MSEGSVLGKRKTAPAEIKNKVKRSEVWQKQKHEKKAEKRKRRKLRQKEAEELGEKAPPKEVPRTIENTPLPVDTKVEENDEEALADEETDEFAQYFKSDQPANILLTTSPWPSSEGLTFVNELSGLIPNCHYYKRGTFSLRDIVQWGTKRGFTDVLVVNENQKKPNALLHVHLPDGPTALYRISSIIYRKQIIGHAKATSHTPELILKNFHTRLGHSISRMLTCLFPHKPQFEGRNVVTFHNQRDYIFVRRHRYICEEDKKVRLQEIGPRFSLKLKWLQHGVFDAKDGEYEFIRKASMDVDRRKFYL